MQVLRHAQYLKHGQYGLGVVTESNAERTTIDFEIYGVKKFVTSLLVAELMPGAAPAKLATPKRLKKKAPASAKAKAQAGPQEA
ncbi:MAG: hypothetical protein HY647_13385 [Acidobacteria bacterium]|nr:hypothetical protein [Acidobacteriota bacterium]